MKAFIVSMSLFVVVAAHIVLRQPANKTETIKSTVTAKGKMENTEPSASAAYRKSRKASEEDCAAVRAIAPECAKEIGHTVALREKLKTSEYYERFGGNACSPELIAKCNKVNFAFSRAARKVRDLEWEQWAKMAEYLSPYELRKYKLEHSQFAHDLRRETKWSQLNEGEFLALFIDHERKRNLHDEMAGKGKKMEELFQSARKKIEAVHDKMWGFRSHYISECRKAGRSYQCVGRGRHGFLSGMEKLKKRN